MFASTFAPGTLFSHIFHASPVGMTINLIPDGIYVDVNQAFVTMVGRSREELIGRRAIDLDIIKPQERQPVVDNLTRAGLLSNSPTLLRRPTGEIREGIVSAHLEKYEGQTYAIAFVQDLTEHHRVQEELLAAEVRFRLFFDGVPLPVWVSDLHTGRILDANPAAARAYGYSLEELLTMTVMDVLPPAERAAFQTGPPWLPEGTRSVWRHQKKDGALMDVSISGYPFDLNGRAVRLDVLNDITERLATERALVNRERRLKLITELSTDGIWEWDVASGAYELNETYRQAFGAPPESEDLIAWWLMRIHPEDRAGVNEFFLDIAGGTLDHWSTEYRMLRADGAAYATVLARGRITRDSQGRIARMTGALGDITTQIEVAEAAARATLAERERLAGDLHDSVTQSLYSVSLLAEVARRRAQAGDHAETVEQLARLGELAQQCLREMRLLVYELRPPLAEEIGLISALQHRLEAVEQRSGVRVDFRAGSDRAIPSGMRNTLFRVGEEVLNHSLKCTRASTLRVRVSASPTGVELEIADNGAGFDPAELAAAAPGLDYARECLRQMGGDLVVHSAPGAPTTVRAWVPLAPAAATERAAVEGEPVPLLS
jgi:PAS domain S-box-containing protein